jgi:uncharacterized protein (DUF1330 family)
MLRALLILLAMLWPAFAIAEPLTFVAIASGEKVREADYEQFLEKVAPIWTRHGMRVVFRADASGDAADTFTDIVLIEVESRAGFQAYLADPAYRIIAPIRFEAVDHLAILEGARTVLPPAFEPGTPINILFQRECEAGTPGARVALVGAVKGEMADFYSETGCVRFFTTGDIPASDVLAGFAATIR